MSLLIIAIISFLAFGSMTTTEVCTTTRANDKKRATASEMKKIKNSGFGAILASPRENPGLIAFGLSKYWPGTLKMAANATVAMRTATIVVELIALLSPSLCLLLSRLAMSCTRFVV
ncbi:hypothetical protein SLE2022_103110 [Rubroshorea leprosula]